MTTHTKRRLCATFFAMLASSLIVDLALTLRYGSREVGAGSYTGLVCLYAVWVVWSLAAAARVWKGRGSRLSLALVVCLTFFLVALAIAFSGAGDYAPPAAVWITHGMIVLSLFAASIALAYALRVESGD